VREGSPEIPGPERGPSGNGPPVKRVDDKDPRAREAARVVLDQAGPRDPARVRQERTARTAPFAGRVVVRERVEPQRTPPPAREAAPDERGRDRDAPREQREER
jgi:hypothetical protein